MVVSARVLVVTAAMGDGHLRVARELADRLTRRGHHVVVVDLLAALPGRLGHRLCVFYAGLLRYAPWGYQAIYRVFFVAKTPWRSSVSPLTALAARTLATAVAAERPDVVIATFHLAGQAAGRLRQQRRLMVPAVTFVTDFAVHRLWLHPGTDRYLCVHSSAAAQVLAGGGTALAPRPVVAERFLATPDPARVARLRAEFAPAGDQRIVLVAAGAWGTGDITATANALVRSGRYCPIVLCGRNDDLRTRLVAQPGVTALGWRDDVADLMAAADVLVENAAGLTCLEAMAVGLPVVTYRPIPGHGADSARRMAAAMVSVLAEDDNELLAALDRLSMPGPVRERQRAAGAALFAAGDAADDVVELLGVGR